MFLTVSLLLSWGKRKSNLHKREEVSKPLRFWLVVSRQIHMLSIGRLEWVLSICRTPSHSKVLTLFTFMLGMISDKGCINPLLATFFIYSVNISTYQYKEDWQLFCKDDVEDKWSWKIISIFSLSVLMCVPCKHTPALTMGFVFRQNNGGFRSEQIRMFLRL